MYVVHPIRGLRPPKIYKSFISLIFHKITDMQQLAAICLLNLSSIEDIVYHRSELDINKCNTQTIGGYDSLSSLKSRITTRSVGFFKLYIYF